MHYCDRNHRLMWWKPFCSIQRHPFHRHLASKFVSIMRRTTLRIPFRASYWKTSNVMHRTKLDITDCLRYYKHNRPRGRRSFSMVDISCTGSDKLCCFSSISTKLENCYRYGITCLNSMTKFSLKNSSTCKIPLCTILWVIHKNILTYSQIIYVLNSKCLRITWFILYEYQVQKFATQLVIIRIAAFPKWEYSQYQMQHKGDCKRPKRKLYLDSKHFWC